MIIQGSNKPIELEFDEPIAEVPVISVTITDTQGRILLKKLSKNLIIDGNKIIVPVTQEQTANFPLGTVKILVKWKGADGYVEFAEEATVEVVNRDDKVVFL